MDGGSKVVLFSTSTRIGKTTDGTLMQLMNRAGFKTYWISNQKPFGTYESITSKLSRTANEGTFLDTASEKSSLAFDDRLITPFQKALADTFDKKMIFIKLILNN
jgi:heptose-I-phosphate ethanolaminephosphotransferase